MATHLHSDDLPLLSPGQTDLASMEADGNSKRPITDEPLLRKPENPGREQSYANENGGRSIEEMEQTLNDMESKYAAYVRHDTYGTMGKGDIPIVEKMILVVALLILVPIKVLLLLLILVTYFIICRLCTMFRTPERNTYEEGNSSSSSVSPLKLEGEMNGSSVTNGGESNGDIKSLNGGQENYAHLSGIRRAIIVHTGRFLSRAILFVLGFYWIKVTRITQEGEALETTSIRPGAIVSNHVSYTDILYHMSASFPSFVAKRSVAKLPLIGLISKCLGCVYVQREDKPTDFKGVAGIITKRLLAAVNDENAPNMMLFPEGTTTNGFYLLPFKTGAFLAGTPVQPVILKYPYQRFSPAWDSISGVRHVILLLCQFINYLEVIWLPIYVPSETEKADPKLYANNVRKVMALEGGLMLSDIGLQEKRTYHSFLNEYLASKPF